MSLLCDLNPAAAVLEMGNQIISRIWPDPAQQADAHLKLATLAQNGELKELEANYQLALAQVVNNTADANSASFFRGGWRPFIGWVCGMGLAYQFLLRPLLQMTLGLLAVKGVVLTDLDTGTLMTLLTGMLGLGGLRSFEKTKGIP